MLLTPCCSRHTELAALEAEEQHEGDTETVAGAHPQVERMERDLKTGAVSGSGGRAAGGDAPPTPTRKLGKAIGDENERFLSGQSQQQQQIIRWASLLHGCWRHHRPVLHCSGS